MIKLSLLTFLQSGQLGSIQLGMTREQVCSFLGEPDDVGQISRKYRRPQVWAYGDIELHWPGLAEDLRMIFLDHFTIPDGGKAIQLDPWYIRGGITRKQLETLMTQATINYSTIDAGILKDTHEILETSSGVRLTFVNDGEYMGLFSVSLSHWKSAT